MTTSTTAVPPVNSVLTPSDVKLPAVPTVMRWLYSSVPAVGAPVLKSVWKPVSVPKVLLPGL